MCFFILYNCLVFSQQSQFLDSLVRTDLKKYQSVLSDPAKFRFQVIYTRIDRDEHNSPSFTDHYLDTSSRYVYPASTVKLPMGILAAIKLQELNNQALQLSTPMITDSAFFCQKRITKDTSAPGGLPTLGNYIRKMFLVSDNAAFARTYEFVGYDYSHQKLNDLGYPNIRLLNRLDGQCPGDTAAVTPPVYFLNQNGDTVYRQGLTQFTKKLAHPARQSIAGRFHQVRGKWVAGPRDFSQHNYMTITDLHHLMKQLVFNNYAAGREKLPLDENSRLFLLKALGQYPRESDFPKYPAKTYYDSFKKYFIYGSVVPVIAEDSLRMINIVGRAFGFLIDCAYIVDLRNNTEFLLTASVFVNANGRIGSGKYEYDQLGLPLLRDLSLSLYRAERQRSRKHSPDLDEFRRLFQKN